MQGGSDKKVNEFEKVGLSFSYSIGVVGGLMGMKRNSNKNFDQVEFEIDQEEEEDWISFWNYNTNRTGCGLILSWEGQSINWVWCCGDAYHTLVVLSSLQSQSAILKNAIGESCLLGTWGLIRDRICNPCFLFDWLWNNPPPFNWSSESSVKYDLTNRQMRRMRRFDIN